jgi:hypothetical protein
MGNFQGGSAYAMANQIAEGHVMVTERTFTRMQKPELDTLAFEMEKLLRSVRGTQPESEDTQALQRRNRKISRVNSALMMLRAHRQRRR